MAKRIMEIQDVKGLLLVMLEWWVGFIACRCAQSNMIRLMSCGFLRSANVGDEYGGGRSGLCGEPILHLAGKSG